jgi:predicted nucleic acid-binding protein
MIVLDTSVLIRFFTRDNETKAQKVKALLESDSELLLIDAVLMELIFTLSKFYLVTKNQIIEMLSFLLTRSNISISMEFKRAAVLFKENNISITDCLIIAHSEGKSIASFDERLLKVSGVKSVFK